MPSVIANYIRQWLFAKNGEFAPKTYANPAIPPEEHLYAYLKNGSQISMKVDGSSTPVAFDYAVPAGRFVVLTCLNIVALDGGISMSEFLGENNELPNGVLFQCLDTDGITVLNHLSTDDMPLRRTIDFAALTGRGIDAARESGDDPASLSWPFEAAGRAIKLTAGQRFRCLIRDDLTSISEIRAMLQGYQVIL